MFNLYLEFAACCRRAVTATEGIPRNQTVMNVRLPGRLPTALRIVAGRALGILLGLGLMSAVSPANGDTPDREHNAWPFGVRDRDPATGTESWTAAGPFLFRKPNADADGNTASGFRPFWVQLTDREGQFRAGYVLYPLFSYTVDEKTFRWSFFEIIRRWDRRADSGAPTSVFDQRARFEVFPFWFSREAGDPEMSYRGLFPIYGTVKNRLGFERLSWTLFPFYVENEQRGAVTTSTPWPFIRVTRGAAHGWGVWPLYNCVERPGVSRYETYLWPLGYNATRQPTPDDPPGTPPKRDLGALPFYARSTGPGYINEDFLWPFFGYTERTSPRRYSERRYFWPFLVQGRGDDHTVNRWAPFYTYSLNKGYEKEWYLWPLVRSANWNDQGIERKRTQFLYFVYWNEEQRVGPRAAPATAELTHLWPLYSNWQDGAGRRQWQVCSPLDVFFPQIDKVNNTWSPLFAIARYDQRTPGDTRTSLLWNFVTWEQHVRESEGEFHLGPLLGVVTGPREQRVAIGNGLFGMKRTPGERAWRAFLFDFPAKAVTNTASARSP